jgi:hypothetical protein
MNTNSATIIGKYYLQNTIEGYFPYSKDVKRQVVLDLENKSMTISTMIYANSEQYIRSDCKKYTKETQDKAKELLGLENGMVVFGDVYYDPELGYQREGVIFYQITDEFIDKIHALTMIKMKGKKDVY